MSVLNVHAYCKSYNVHRYLTLYTHHGIMYLKEIKHNLMHNNCILILNIILNVYFWFSSHAFTIYSCFHYNP